MSDDLRRLAEQAAKSDRYDEDFIAYVNAVRDPQAILALLDLRDGLLVRLGQATERAKAAERRVAALESERERLWERLLPYIRVKDQAKARALLSEPPVGSLAAAPSEPGHPYHGVPSLHPDKRCFCDADPAALPAEVDLATWVPPRPDFSKPPADPAGPGRR